MKLDYVFFDCWDTLIAYKEKEEDFFKPFYDHIKDKHGYSLSDIKKVRSFVMNDYYGDMKYELDFKTLFAITLKLLGLELDLPPEKYEDIWCQNYDPSPMPNILKLLNYLKDRQIPMAVLSNTVLSRAKTEEFIFKTLGIKSGEFFDFVSASSEEGAKKPNPIFFWMGMQKAGLKKGATALYVGDSFHQDICGSYRAGLTPCYYNWKGAKRADRDEFKGLFEFCDYDELIALIDSDREYQVRFDKVESQPKEVIDEW